MWFPKLNHTSHYGFLFVVSLVSLAVWGKRWPCHENNPPPSWWGNESSYQQPLRPLANSHVRWSPWSGPSGPSHTLSNHGPNQRLDCSFMGDSQNDPAKLLLNFWPTENKIRHVYCSKLLTCCCSVGFFFLFWQQ